MGWWDDISNVTPRSLPPGREQGGPYSSLLRNADWDKIAMLLSPMPVIGDVAGLAADARRYYDDPESRTMGNFGLTAAGLLPFVPGMTTDKKLVELAEKAKPVSGEVLPRTDLLPKQKVIEVPAELATTPLKGSTWKYVNRSGTEAKLSWLEEEAVAAAESYMHGVYGKIDYAKAHEAFVNMPKHKRGSLIDDGLQLIDDKGLNRVFYNPLPKAVK